MTSPVAGSRQRIPNGGVHVHVDHHARAYVGNDSTQMLIGSDGGVYYSANVNADTTIPATNGKSLVKWIELNDTINSIEFYFGDITGKLRERGDTGGRRGRAGQRLLSRALQWRSDRRGLVELDL